MKLWLAVLLLAGASPLAAAPLEIGFAPPLDRTLLYRIEQHRPVEARDSLFRAERELRFERAGDGYILHATLRSLDSDAPASGAEPYRAALSPLIGVPCDFRLDAQGHIIALDNMDAVWKAVESGLQAMIARFPPDSPRHRTAQNVLTLFAGLTPEGRLALLAGEIQPLLLFADSVMDDAAPRDVQTLAGSPLGRGVPVKGTLAVRAQAGILLTLDEDLRGEGVHVMMRYGLSRVTGLVETQARTLQVGTDILTETRTLVPVDK